MEEGRCTPLPCTRACSQLHNAASLVVLCGYELQSLEIECLPGHIHMCAMSDKTFIVTTHDKSCPFARMNLLSKGCRKLWLACSSYDGTLPSSPELSDCAGASHPCCSPAGSSMRSCLSCMAAENTCDTGPGSLTHAAQGLSALLPGKPAACAGPADPTSQPAGLCLRACHEACC